MKYCPLFIFLLAFLSFYSCQDDDTSTSCEEFIEDVVSDNEAQVISFMNTLTNDLFASPTSLDPLGHNNNFNELIRRMEISCPDIDISIRCYGCIETFPLTSELLISVLWSDEVITKIIDIRTPDDGVLQASGMHD